MWINNGMLVGTDFCPQKHQYGHDGHLCTKSLYFGSSGLYSLAKQWMPSGNDESTLLVF